MKRHYLATAIGAATLLALAGAAEAQVKLELVEVITSPQRTEVLRQILDEFEAANPGVSVELNSFVWGGGGPAFQKLLATVAAGDAPDVVEMPNQWLGTFASGANGLVNLETRLADYRASEEGSDLVQTAIDLARSFNNTAFMMPYGFFVRALFWNKPVFAEAGLDRPPATIAEFVDDAKRISQVPGRTGYCLRGGSGGFNMYQMLMLGMLGDNAFFDDQGNSIFTRPEALEGAQILIDIYQNGWAPEDSVNWAFSEVVAGFVSGQCAMLDQDPDSLIFIEERMNPEDFGVVPMPVGPSGKAFPTVGFFGWSMFDSSAHKKEAWDLIKFLSNTDANLRWSKVFGTIPIHAGAQNDPTFATQRFEGFFTELNDPRYEPTASPSYLKEWANFVNVTALQSWQEALLGQRSVPDMLGLWDEVTSKAQKRYLSETQ